jgi:hypothetical protein
MTREDRFLARVDRDPCNPIRADDFMLTLAGLAARSASRAPRVLGNRAMPLGDRGRDPRTPYIVYEFSYNGTNRGRACGTSDEHRSLVLLAYLLSLKELVEQ